MAFTNPVLGVYASAKMWITGKDEHWPLILRDKDAISGRCYDYVRNPNNGRSGHGVVFRSMSASTTLTSSLPRTWANSGLDTWIIRMTWLLGCNTGVGMVRGGG